MVRYRVRRGQTLLGVARANGVSVASLRSWNHLSRRARLRAGETLTIYETRTVAVSRSRSQMASADNGGNAEYHTVRPGETLTRIAHNFNTTVAQLSDWNAGLTADGLQAGMKIRVTPNGPAQTAAVTAPAPRATRNARLAYQGAGHMKSYRVRPGDTLYAISERFDVEIADLKHANHLRGSAIVPGQRLRIPE